ncbi:ATP-binding cassette domain-containing protein [Kineococcus gynurae]|uniref:ATP-binding cassette domain-containing protein n=1 Tax=Kineococcus gynurae TaxID=452979 RepID=A0ABV5LUA6_9ACTN
MSAETPEGTSPGPEAPAEPERAVLAHRLTLPGVRAEPVDLDLPAGGLGVVVGPAGSGRTSLLLAAAGRMRPTGGTLTVLGHDLPRGAGAVRRQAALAEVRGVNELDDALTVEQHVAERLVLHRPWWKPWATRAAVAAQLDRVAAVLTAAQVDRTPLADLPPLRPQAFVSDIDPLERMVLGVVLALVGRPRLLVVDDVDALRRTEDRALAWRALAVLTGPSGVTVLAAATSVDDLPDDVARTVCAITPTTAGPRHLRPRHPEDR